MKNYIFGLIFLIPNILSAFVHNENKSNIDSIIFQLKSLPEDSIKVNAILNLVENLNNIHSDKTIYYANKAFGLSKEINYKKGISNSLYYLGKAYTNKAEYKLAMETFFKKIEVDSEFGDKNTLAANYSYIGDLFYKVTQYDKALEYYKKSLQLLKELDDNEKLGVIYNNIGNIYEAYKQPEHAEENYWLSINIYKDLKNHQRLAITYNNLGNLYYKHYNDTLAGNYFYDAINYLQFINEPNISALVFQNIGDFFIWKEKYDSATFYLSKAYNISRKSDLPYFKRNVAYSLSQVFASLKEYKKAFEFQSVYQQLDDSIFNVNNSAKLTLLEFQYQQEKKEIEQHLYYLNQQKKTKNTIWTMVVFFIIMVSITIYFIIFQKGKIKQAVLTKENIKLETIRLKELLEYRNKKIVLMTMNLIERNELINNVINKLKILLPKTKKANSYEIEEIIRDLKNNYQDNILKEFEYRFNKVHVNFYKNLKKDFNNLTSNELRLCAFLKMNMSTKDIASLTHQSINSIEVARTRLRKKLNLNNSDVDLIGFFTQY